MRRHALLATGARREGDADFHELANFACPRLRSLAPETEWIQEEDSAPQHPNGTVLGMGRTSIPSHEATPLTVNMGEVCGRPFASGEWDAVFRSCGLCAF